MQYKLAEGINSLFIQRSRRLDRPCNPRLEMYSGRVREIIYFTKEVLGTHIFGPA